MTHPDTMTLSESPELLVQLVCLMADVLRCIGGRERLHGLLRFRQVVFEGALQVPMRLLGLHGLRAGGRKGFKV